MNSLAILSVFCILFVWVVESNSNRNADQKICGLNENEDGRKVVVDCFNQHMPAFVNKLIEQCYEEGFNEPGSLNSYVAKVCKAEEYQDEITATVKCMREKMDEEQEAAGIDEEQMQNNAKLTTECLLASAGDDESNELEEAIEAVEEIEEAIGDIEEVANALDELEEAIDAIE